MREQDDCSAQRAGLTVVELLLVVAIIGLLVALVGPHYLQGVRAARQGRAIANLRTLGTAETTFYAANGRFGRFEDLFASGAAPAGFARNLPSASGRPTSGAAEIIGDGAYRYKLAFTLGALGITVDADPEPGRAATHCWYRARVGRVTRGTSGGEGAIYYADPRPTPPPSRAYRLLGGAR
jgi:Tfp pilus assembly protein PilE